MAISRNQLLLGAGIVGVLAVLYFRNRRSSGKKIDLKDIESQMPETSEEIPMPEPDKESPMDVKPTKTPTGTGGVKPQKTPRVGSPKPMPVPTPYTPPIVDVLPINQPILTKPPRVPSVPRVPRVPRDVSLGGNMLDTNFFSGTVGDADMLNAKVK